MVYFRFADFGVGIGSFGSLAMVAIGPIANDAGILYVWPLAIVLMLVCPRMLCFAYAGGILSLTHLLFGVPKIGVPQLLTIIAVLHMVESILIWIDGYYAAIPGFFRLSDGQHTGGYLLQRFWIVPLSLVWAVPVSGGLEMGSAIQMPEWWPLIRTGVEQYRRRVCTYCLPYTCRPWVEISHMRGCPTRRFN